MSDSKQCPECGGSTIEFKGKGSSLQSRTCSKVHDKEFHHLTEAEAKAKWQKHVAANMPSSGRF